MPINNALRRTDLSPLSMMIVPKSNRKATSSRRTPSRTCSDEWSISSTMTANTAGTAGTNGTTKSALHKQAKRRTVRVRRRVHFDLDQNIEYDNTIVCEEDIKPLWYSGEDMALQRVKAKKTAIEIAKMEKENTSSSSYKRVLQRTFLACCQCSFETNGSVLTVTEEKRLTKRLREGPIRLGLERLSIRNIGMDRFDRRADMRQLVFSIQEAAYEAERTIHTDHTAEKIRLACERLSRPSRLFARHTAIALFPKNVDE